MNDKRQLLCTFSTTKLHRQIVDEIQKFYKVINEKFFVFSNIKNTDEVFITYNISNKDERDEKFKNTISIHRKKQTNTLYTLNAMNQIIRDENEGVFDKTFSINWQLYENSLILTGDISFRIIPIKILNIIS